MNPPSFIYHITTSQAWQQAKPTGNYTPAGFAADGFIHCSLLNQVLPVANRFYSGFNGLVVLQIDIGRLPARPVFENLEGGTELFPHIYGELNLDAITRVVPLSVDPDGHFSLPDMPED